MRKSPRLSLLILAIAISEAVSSQPVFTYFDFAPQPGDQYTVSNAQYINPGSSGANQTWNFTASNVTGNATYSVSAVSAIPCGNQYPACNLGIGASGYEMMQITTSDYNCVGNTVTPGQANFIYSDGEKRFEFPMNYNSAFSDVFSGVSNVTQTTYRNGSQSVIYDGYGTIITPVGTYTNAIRVRRTVTWTDSTQLGSTSCSGDYYYWFVSGYRYPVAQIWSLNCLSTGAMFLQSITIGINESDVTSPLVSVFPNPFSSSIRLDCQESCLNEIAIISDATGRMVKTFVISNSSMFIELGDLEDGLYFLSVGDNRLVRIIRSSPE